MTFNELLDLNVGSSTHPQPWETYFAQVFSQIGTVQAPGAVISNVKNLLVVQANGDGQGAEITWETIGTFATLA